MKDNEGWLQKRYPSNPNSIPIAIEAFNKNMMSTESCFYEGKNENETMRMASGVNYVWQNIHPLLVHPLPYFHMQIYRLLY